MSRILYPPGGGKWGFKRNVIDIPKSFLTLHWTIFSAFFSLVGHPLLFVVSLMPRTGSNIIWTGMLAMVNTFSIILPNITLMGYAPLSYPDPNIMLKRCQDYWSALKKKSEHRK